MKNEKMATIIERLCSHRQRALGDFIRPRGVPLDVWRRMSADEKVAHEMKRVRVSA